MGLADPAALDRAAKAIEAEAKTLRDAKPYGQATKDMIWSGLAATSFRNQAEADVKQVGSLADRLVSITAEIRKGATEVRKEIARRAEEARKAREEAERRAAEEKQPAGAGPR